MDEVQLIGTLIVVGVPVIGSIVALVRPFLKATVDLNTTITKLNDKLDHLFDQTDRQDKRLDAHGKRLDSLEHSVTEHEAKIEQLRYDHRNRSCGKD